VETLWFILVAGMLTAYVALDGFDIGAGIIYYIVGRSPVERQVVLRSIGPIWDGNEVWLIAAGGTLFFAFPALYASSFSGFYLPLMMVLWLLMLRGISIELRSHIDNPMWQSFFDWVFCSSCILLAIFFGAALGNVIRGVPLNQDGYFFEPLWTTFTTGVADTGILDWYTVLAGLLALAALSVHGANYVALKTAGDINARAKRVAGSGGWLLALLTIVSLLATLSVRPHILDNYKAQPVGLIFPVAVAASLVGMRIFRTKGRDFLAFLCSSLYLAAMLGGAAFAVYPTLLWATTGEDRSLTIHNAAADRYGLGIGLRWWIFGMILTIAYVTYLYRSFRGKVDLEKGEGY
jgi:cytochrome d ubiquinol oxidase subunit II